METVEFILGPSKGFSVYLWSLFLGVAFTVFYLPIFYFFKMIGIALLFLYSWQLWNLHGRRSAKKAIIRVWQDSKGRWGCETKDGHAAIGRLKADSFRSLWFTILRFHFHHRGLSVIIPKDALSLNEYRILSVRLHRFL